MRYVCSCLALAHVLSFSITTDSSLPCKTQEQPTTITSAYLRSTTASCDNDMPLLQLPKEIFAQIIDVVVKEEGRYHIRHVVGHRLVCHESTNLTKWTHLTSIGTFNTFLRQT